MAACCHRCSDTIITIIRGGRKKSGILILLGLVGERSEEGNVYRDAKKRDLCHWFQRPVCLTSYTTELLFHLGFSRATRHKAICGFFLRTPLGCFLCASQILAKCCEPKRLFGAPGKKMRRLRRRRFSEFLHIHTFPHSPVMELHVDSKTVLV